MRWEEGVATLDVTLKALPLNSLLAAAFIAYLPSQPEDERQARLAEWTTYLNVERFDLRRFMSTESEMLTWKAEGLPGDELSMENAIVILQTVGWCKLDPSLKATCFQPLKPESAYIAFNLKPCFSELAPLQHGGCAAHHRPVHAGVHVAEEARRRAGEGVAGDGDDARPEVRRCRLTSG